MARPKFRTEQEVNDYYDERGFKIENKYAKQINRIDATYEAWDRNYPIQNEKLDEKIQKNDERITKLSETISYTPNEKLTSSEEELQKLKDEIKSNLDIGIAPDRNQATRQAELELEIKQLKKDAQFETRQNQDIKNEIVSLEETQRQLILQQKNFSDALEDKQNALVSKRDEIAEKFDSDIQRNEQLRQQAIDNLPKTVPDRVVDVDGYAWTDY